jgi:N-hydroxyarylamine O-acetyltransferase
VTDLDAYLDRIGLAGPLGPTLETLHRITAAHVETIPFENLDVLLERPIHIGAEDLERKLVAERRGGYCFEQNGLLLEVLNQLGFDVRPLSARVRYQRPRDFTPPRTHVFLRVELDGTSWLADVGVGGNSMTGAIRLHEDGEQATSHEPRRILREGGLFYNQVRFGEEWHDVYEFTLEEMPAIDRELANWYTSAHPQSHFRDQLIVARALPGGGRLSLLNRRRTERVDGVFTTRTVETPEELLDVLRTDFGIELPEGTTFTCPGLVWD